MLFKEDSNREVSLPPSLPLFFLLITNSVGTYKVPGSALDARHFERNQMDT